jgi:hypothetical protein
VLAVAPPPRVAVVPNAIAFRDPQHGIMGTGDRGCADPSERCRPQGTLSITSDGGKSWRVLFRTRRPVVFVTYSGGQEWARFDDGEVLTSTDGGRHWSPAVPSNPWNGFSTCPLGMARQDNTGNSDWSLCTTQGGTGAMGKAVYRDVPDHGWKRIAYTPFAPPAASYGGIDLMGYPLGISVAEDGFGMIWEDRGPLYVTRDGGSHWIAVPNLVPIDVDVGLSASALRHGVGFFLKWKNAGTGEVLYRTNDAGRSWRVVHAWK